MSIFANIAISFAEEAEPSIATTIELVIGLLAVVVVLAIIAPRLRIPYSILLVVGGLVLALVPGVPAINLNPELVFLLFLPPLLYASAWFTSWRDFRANIRPISFLAIGLVLITTIVVGIVVRMVVPGIPWAVAFLIGAIISPTDAVAATAIAQPLGIGGRIVTILEGESLVNDATGLVAYRFAIAAAVSGAFSLADFGLQFFLVSIGGIVVGLIFGWLVSWVHRLLDYPSIEIVITLLTPFVVYLVAEAVNVSGVLAVVATGLYMTWRAPLLFSAATRLQTLAVWSTLIFLLNGLVFILIGLQFRGVLTTLQQELNGRSLWVPIGYAAIVSLTAIVIRIVWVFAATYVPRWVSARLRERDPYPGWRNVVIISWTGMRGVVSLAAALALPTVIESGAPFPERALVIFLTFGVILATLIFQGLSLPFLIRGLGVKGDGVAEREEAQARLASTQAALERIDELVQQGTVKEEAATHLKKHYQARAKNIRAGDDSDDELEEDHETVYERLQREALKAERKAVIQLRNRGVIGDEVLHLLEREFDLDEERLMR